MKERMKERIDQIKESLDKLNSRTKKLLIIGIAALIIGAVAVALVLNNRPYAVLFTGLNSQEAQQIAGKLQEDGIAFRYEGDSTILVRSDVLDATKATLVQEGYPKSGFTYDTFINNAGMMTTDSDKSRYELYQLQDRIGATIRLFDGVDDAKVTIALGEKSKYALDDEDVRSSATAVVTMSDGSSPTEDQAIAIQRLVAKSVPNMELSDVAVFDGNGNDVSQESGTASNGSDAEEIAQIVESRIAQNVMEVLGPIYGENNVSVSARAQINMEELIRESVSYTTPEKIDDQDKTGIISREELYNEYSGTDEVVRGIAGTDANADTPQYNTNGVQEGISATSDSAIRDYLVDQVKEQGQVSPGVLEDLTVSVVINGNGYGSLREAQVRALVANAAGIAEEDQNAKISVANAPFYEEEETQDTEMTSATIFGIPIIYFIVGGLLALLLLIILILAIMRKRRKKEEEEEEAELTGGEGVLENTVLDMNQELQEIQNDRGMELKRNIREFAEQNAEISAQLLKSWLNGGDANGE